MFHRHTWKIIDSKEQPSQAETFFKSGGTRIERAPSEFLVKEVLVTSRCTTCGTEKMERI